MEHTMEARLSSETKTGVFMFIYIFMFLRLRHACSTFTARQFVFSYFIIKRHVCAEVVIKCSHLHLN